MRSMFSDFPDSTAFLSQECSVEDVWMEVTTNGMAGLANLCEARLRMMQQELRCAKRALHHP